MNKIGLRGMRIGTRRGVGVALVCWLAVSLLYVIGVFETSDLKLLDWRHRIRGPRAASDAIALIEIDDATIEAYGNWPLPRDQYALLIEAITQAGARAIGVDLLFLGPDRYDTRFDALLAYVTSNHSDVVHAITFSPEEMRFGSGIVDVPEGADALESHGITGLHVPAFNAATITLPFSDLVASSKMLGHVLVVIDRDGVIRRVPTFVEYRHALYPCLGLRVAALSPSGEQAFTLEAAPRGLWVNRESGRRLFVPIDRDGATCIDYAGDRRAFTHAYSMLAVLQWYAAGDSTRLRQVFENRVVLVGATAVRQVAGDFGSTPFSAATPLLLVHANAVDSFLTGRFIIRANTVAYVAALGGLSILLGWFLTGASAPVALGAIAVWLVGFSGIDHLFFLRGIDVPPTAGLALPPLIYAAIETYQFVFLEGKTRERQKELQIARDIQRRLLPSEAPAVPELDVFGINIPAQEVGGDYYDWIVLGEDALAVGVGDVCGKGIPAAILMAHLEASFHAEAKANIPPGAIVEAMNRSLQRSVEPGRFATFVLAVIYRRSGDLLVCNAGHNPAFLVRQGSLEKLTGGGLALGILQDMVYQDDRRQFESGDILVLYSDGVTECQWKNDMYGEDRLCSAVAKACVDARSAADIGQAILNDVKTFCQGHTESDDLTLVVVKRT